MTDRVDLIARLLALFPPGCSVALADPRTGGAGLWPEERAALPGANATRLGAYAAGRRAARAALTMQGHGTPAIGRDTTGAPLWPAGCHGSISHSATLAAAVVTQDDWALGLDVEEAVPLNTALWPELFTPHETDALRADPDPTAALRHFALKEALYKAVAPGHGAFIAYLDAEIRPASEPGRFTAQLFTKGLTHLRPTLRAQQAGGHWLAGCSLPAPLLQRTVDETQPRAERENMVDNPLAQTPPEARTA